MTAATGSAPTQVRWGREVERGVVAGHPCLVYVHRPRSLAELLLEGRRWPEREFLVQGERRMTRAEHEHAVARVAAHLRARGVGRGDTVLLLGFNRIEWVVAFWAVQAVGAVVALGNAWWSDDEVAGAVSVLAPTLAVTDRTVDGVSTVGFDALQAVAEEPVEVGLDLVPVEEDDLALIMFSSGTTGAPKGVLMSHRSVVANIQNVLGLTGRLPGELAADHPGTVAMLSVPLFHLAGVQVSLTTLLSGGRAVFLPGKFDPAEVLRLIQAEKVRVWGSIPTMVSRVLDHPDFDDYDTSSVSSVPMGGAAISPELRARVSERFAGVRSRVGSLYGLTEAGGVLAAGSGKDITSRPGAVGKALPVVELTIRNPGPDGVGEIGARTPTMTGGYLGDPEPITDADGWIFSGDLGRIDDEGWLYVTGRSKDIVIRGGENIAAAHVESSLATHPEVAEVAVVPLPHPDLGEEVAAAVVLRPGATAAPDELAAHAGRVLARHEVPSRWWLHPGPLPTNASGKILRRTVREEWPDPDDTPNRSARA
ncbi:class I adenylate-forming enzyme family protein [Pseudonocardia sp. RS010]|uniref:class I adenylate-forming enzyme family protein n=1 Tax=Pseudonocardia sp. RS010 TaxID=3385979 RepID=UPI0039A36A66